MATPPENQLKLRDRVVSTVDLPGVPAGTPGRVILRNGFEWVRYRVLFETDEPNGTDVGSLDRSTLQRIDKKGNLLVEAGS